MVQFYTDLDRAEVTAMLDRLSALEEHLKGYELASFVPPGEKTTDGAGGTESAEPEDPSPVQADGTKEGATPPDQAGD